MNSYHLFFDLDRTLWDFDSNSKKALHVIFNDLGLINQMSFNDFYTAYVQINSQLWKEYRNNNISKDELRVKRFNDTLLQLKINNYEMALYMSNAYIELSPYQTKLFPYVIETLSVLKKEGYSMHIITNGFKEVQSIKLNKSGLIKYFDMVICSEEIGCLKPAKEIFSYSLKVSGAQMNNSLMIGDDYKADIIGAQEFGMKTLHFIHNKTKYSGQNNGQFSSFKELPLLIPKLFLK